jgi:hypothetical protein
VLRTRQVIIVFFLLFNTHGVHMNSFFFDCGLRSTLVVLSAKDSVLSATHATVRESGIAATSFMAGVRAATAKHAGVLPTYEVLGA